jgi:GNAT superfamily N-acetyltransferase
MIDSLADGSFVSWIAIENGEIVATSGVSFYTLPPNKNSPNGKVAYISNMFTYPKYRKQGIASKLFDLTVNEAKENKCVKILLNATDMGRPIYEKYGFKDTKNDMVFYTV